MDDPKNPLPSWLPWATTACLAALLACVGELLMLERARARLLRDETLLTEAALKGAENQLEAERIVARRERAQGGLAGIEIEVLSPAAAAPSGQAPWGVLAWDSGSLHAVLKVRGLPQAGPSAAYELWQEGPGRRSLCASLGDTGSACEVQFDLQAPVAPGTRFLVVLGTRSAAGAPTPPPGEGSIVLATLPYTGKIPLR